MAAPLASVREIEREIATLRLAPGEDMPYQRTSVITHTAWVPPEWVEAAEDVLAGLAERHPSRTIVLVPEPDADEDGLEAEGRGRRLPGRRRPADLRRDDSHPPQGQARLGARERRAAALPARSARVPALARRPFLRVGLVRSLVDVVDRLIVDSTEWPELPAPYGPLADVFDRVVVSDIAWARTSRWRRQLASLWPGIADVKTIRVSGTAAQAQLLAGWLRSRLGRDVELEHEHSDHLVGVEIDGNPAPFPPGEPPPPSDLLSAELDRFERDRVYEEAVRSAARERRSPSARSREGNHVSLH